MIRTDMENRIKELRAQLREYRKQWEAHFEESRRIVLEIDFVRKELDRLVSQWLEGRPLSDHWDYWIEKLEAEGTFVYFDGEDRFLFTDWTYGLNPWEGEELEEKWFRAEPGLIPSDHAIRALIAAAKEAGL